MWMLLNGYELVYQTHKQTRKKLKCVLCVYQNSEEVTYADIPAFAGIIFVCLINYFHYI